MKQRNYLLIFLLLTVIFFSAGLFHGLFRSGNVEIQTTSNVDLNGGKYVRMVFIGSSNCMYSNNREIFHMVNSLKSDMGNILRDYSIKFISTGISYDHSPETAIKYLDNMGPFNELLVGAGAFNLGIVNYVSGGSPTPLILLFYEEY